MSTNLWICHRCGQPFLPGVLTHICRNTSLSNDEWQAVQRERDELRAEGDQWQKKVAELWAERERINAEFREQIQVEHAAYQELRAENERLRGWLKRIATTYDHDRHAIWAAKALSENPLEDLVDEQQHERNTAHQQQD